MPAPCSTLTMHVLRLSEINRRVLEAEVQTAIERCFASHCERAWQGLAAHHREELRRRVWDDGFSPLTSALFLDQRCVGEIGRIIQESGLFPIGNGRAAPRKGA